MQILVDTGILLRAFDRSSIEQRAIFRALRKLASDGHDFVTTSQNIAEFWNVSTRPAQARGGLGLEVPVVDRRVKTIEKLTGILPFSDRAYEEWRRLVVEHQIIGVAVHDARLAATMIAGNIQHILTLNESDFRRYTRLTILTPSSEMQKGQVRRFSIDDSACL
jgi:predicted nucleic acid-binding protein